jgi:hypothetical protein
MPEMGQLYETDDLTIAAALLTLGGAAFDGTRLEFGYPRDFSDKLGKRRLIAVRVVDSHMATVPVKLTKPWTDNEGRVYGAGETAPLPRVVFTLDGLYREKMASATMDTPFTADDWAFWVKQFHVSGGLLCGLKAMQTQENLLRNRMRDKHGLASKFQMRVQG